MKPETTQLWYITPTKTFESYSHCLTDQILEALPMDPESLPIKTTIHSIAK